MNNNELIQALQNLYIATTKALLAKSDHDYLLECAKKLESFIVESSENNKVEDK